MTSNSTNAAGGGVDNDGGRKGGLEAADTGQYHSYRGSQDNPEKRYIHIQDPEDSTSPPFDEVVNNAVEEANATGDTKVTDELKAEIYKIVNKALQNSGVGNSGQTPVTAIPSNKGADFQYNATSPSTVSAHSTGSPPPRVFTPPSPQRHGDSYESQPDKRSPSPIAASRSESNRSTGGDNLTRPKLPQRQMTAEEEATILEKIWGKLFDKDGGSTLRLDQFLRGIATHLIEDYEPKNSLVVSPDKMKAFYQATKVTDEVYPWDTIFEDDPKYIGRIYRDLDAPYHLVQKYQQEPRSRHERQDNRPIIPCLTTEGFAKWQTILIQAHPEQEFKRLKRAATNMPINNPDDRKERFPKDIPRRLFPTKDRPEIRDELVAVLEEHTGFKFSFQEDTPTPRAEHRSEPLLRRNSGSASRASFTDESVTSDGMPRASGERERKSRNRWPPEPSVEDEDSTSTPIERERKPYSATPGGGKVHEDGTPMNQPSSYTNLPPPPTNTIGSGLRRSMSNNTRSTNIPPSVTSGGPTSHRLSNAEFSSSPLYGIHQAPHLREVPGTRRRNHSPLRDDMRRSENDIRTYQSASYEPPGYLPRDSFPPPPPPPQNYPPPGGPRYEDDRRYGRERELRREDYVRGGSPNRRAATAEEDYYKQREPPRYL